MDAPFSRSWLTWRRNVFAGWAVLTLLCVTFGAGGLYYAVSKTVAEGGIMFMHRYLGVGPESASGWWLYLYYIINYLFLLFWKCGYEVGLGLFPWTFVRLVCSIAFFSGGWVAYRRARTRYASPGDLVVFGGATGLACLVLLSGAWGFRFWVSSRSADVRQADRALASKYNQTGFDVLKELTVQPDSASKGQPPTNTLLSSISLGTTLHMTAKGARGRTAQELYEVLHLPDTLRESVASGPSQILQRLRHPEPQHVLQRLVGRASAIETRLANAGWFDASPTKSMKSAGLLDLDLEIREEYRRTLEENFDAEVYLRDFDSEELAQEVNKWATEKTNGKIRRVIKKGPKDGAVLANATYFFGEWSAPFDSENTMQRPFIVTRRGKKPDTVWVPTMVRKAKYPYMQRKRGGELILQGVRLPYGETGRMAMYVFVPQDLDQFVRELRPERWDRLTSAMDSTNSEIELSLPKFALRKKLDLIPLLKELGVEQAFTREADFARIINVGSRTDSLRGRPTPFFLNEVEQKIYLKVNERGTEAAAVSFDLRDVSPPPKMKVNRPFYFAIAERETGVILFHGAIRNPVAR
ncbi:hypothetical protein BSZ35_18510 [Salinibacter sp. 10B]|uniref:serpin family protein n=1 Tax=Salinibacter sp. 10B TaxID=1923971 RepID=UPI000CF55E4D|nr:serpin family protein [Salinibacter sp. 10B]PQJ26919.1 hypothetical protein BSZ35_18510 [Salinibacter sp. 10B]